MARIRIEETEGEGAVVRMTSHRRTLTETDIVNFVNLVGLHEPPFIDPKTSRGQTIVALRHLLQNQRDDLVVDFTERVLFDRA